MKQFIVKKRHLLITLATVVSIGGISMSFRDTPFLSQQFFQPEPVLDTIPEKTTYGSLNLKEYDRILNDMDRNVLDQVNKQLKNINLDQISKTVENSLKDLDIDKILKNVDVALNKIDMDKIMKEVRSSLKEADWNRNGGTIKEAMEEAKKEIEKTKIEIRDIDIPNIRRKIEKAKTDLKKSKKKLKELDLNTILTESRSGIDVARSGLKLTREMFIEMEKEGLINTKNGFTIEFKKNALYIDGKKETEQAREKFRKYLNSDNFKIKIDKE